MTCTAVNSGANFAGRLLTHIDCQAQTIGAYGYGALADPNSTVSIILTTLLTVFVALFGIRLMLGYSVGRANLVGRLIRIGIVLTIATSWPAWRAVGYDLIIQSPAEVGHTLAAATGIVGPAEVKERVQRADRAIVALTALGSGRLPGLEQREEFRGEALSDQSGFAWGRLLFLTGNLAPYAIVRLAAGILLALAPLFALFLLLDGPGGVFLGWIRGLSFTAFGSLGISLIQGINLAVIDPWVTDALNRRMAGEFTPSAPTEVAAISLIFMAINFGFLLIALRITFLPQLTQALTETWGDQVTRFTTYSKTGLAIEAPDHGPSPASLTVSSVTAAVRRDQLSSVINVSPLAHTQTAVGGHSELTSRSANHVETLGSSYRRTFARPSISSGTRDRKS